MTPNRSELSPPVIETEALLYDIALFRNRLIPEGRRERLTWEQLTARLSKHAIRPVKDGSAWSPTLYRPGPLYRDWHNVEALTLLVLDVDDGTDLDELRPGIAEYEWVAYTTHSHTAAHPKFRLVFPLLDPVPVDHWRKVWAGAAAVLGSGHVDRACKNVARLYYDPAAPVERRAEKWAERNKGRLVDPAEMAAAAPVEEKRRRPAPPRPLTAGAGDYKTLDVQKWFEGHGSYGKRLEGTKHAVVCPWIGEHTQESKPEDSDSVVWEADGARWPSFFCSHNHCEGRGIADVLEEWPDADLFCSQPFVPLRSVAPPHGDEDVPRNGGSGTNGAGRATVGAICPGSARPWATARSLLAKTLPPLEWVVPGVIPEGLTVFGGRPKQGKSWGIYGVGLAVACGGMAFGKIPVPQGDVLYLALEDGERRLQSRMRSLLKGEAAPEGFDWAITWPKLAQPGQIPTPDHPDCLMSLRWWLDEHPNARLIAVDTFARVRNKAPKGGNAYEDDTDVMAPIHRLALERRVGLVLVTHTRKPPARGADSSDFLDEIQGSTGVTGVADTILGLKKTGEQEVSLFCRGRDVDEQELLIEWDADTSDWRLLGNADRLRLTELQAELVAVLRTASSSLHYRVIARNVGKAGRAGEKTVNVVLRRLADRGVINSFADGFYSLPPDSSP